MNGLHDVNADERRRMIAEAAYDRAKARGFANGDPFTDWLEAEREIDASLRRNADGGAENWLKQLEGRLSTAREEFRAAKKKVGRRAKSARAEWQKDVEKLEALLDKLEDRLGKLRERGEKATQKARAQAEKVWDDIAELRQRLARKQK